MQPGTLFADRFEIEREAGSGGMGTVYRAKDVLDGSAVAVKLLHAQGEQETRRFVREGKILAELKHPGIVRYVAHGVSPAGEAWLAMEWLEGEDLAARLRRELPSVRESIALVRRVAEILAVAHAKGIVHRDLKPPNLFLPDGRLDRAKVLDFGIAHVDAATRATRTGMMIGTPGYMAPEQARGDRALDARADVFALGCVLFECLTARAPFLGDHVMAVLAKILLEDAPRASELRAGLPDAVDDLVARMLSRKADGRPADGAALVIEIDAIGEIGDLPFTPSVIPAAALTAGEQRLLSVVLLGSPMDPVAPPEVAATLTPEQEEAPLATLRAAAEAYGGKIERLVDGSIVAVLSGTGAATDQAARAARCALAMRSVAREGSMALVTGLGEVAGRWPVGEVVDRAAPLLRAAGSRIFVDEVTAGLLGVRFEVRREGEGLVLHGEREVIEGARTLLGKETPCVGRERELGVLTGLWEECVEEPVARPVIVTAPPGVGKSRLRYEFLHRLEEREDGAEIWIGRGDPMSAGSPFGMLAQAIRGACGVRDGEPIQVRQSKVRARVARSVSGPDHQRVTEFLGELAGVSFPDDDSVQLRAARQNAIIMGDQMRRAWEDFLLAETSAHPVLLVLEDLHWGDLPTVTFVDAALRNLRDRPMMVLATARPEVEELFPKLWAERRLQEIRLDELSKRASEKLVRAVVPDAGAETIARIIDRAAGNAFFLEELVRAEVQGQHGEAPGSVLAMVQARLEALPAESRRVLRAASVFGQVAWKSGIAKLLGGERSSDANDWLPELVDAEILVRRGEGRFPGEEEFAFRHALVRDAAYGMLTEADRTLGHRLAGDWLETTGERDALVLAEHFERGQKPARAIGWYTKAAADALQGNDFAATIERAERAVACGAGGEALGQVRLLQAEAHRWRGEYSLAKQSAAASAQSVAAGGVLWYGSRGEDVIASGQLALHEDLVALAREVLEAPRSAGTAAAFVGAAARAATQLLHAARYALADELLARIDSQAAVSADAPGVVPWIHFARALRASFEGDWGGYLRLCESAAEAAESAGDVRYACLMRVNSGYAHIEVGEYELAERALSDAIGKAERLGLPQFVSAARNNLGLALARLGRLDEAKDVESSAVAEFAKLGMQRMEGGSRLYLATIHGLRGDLEAAEAEARRAVDQLQVAPALEPYAEATLAKILLARGRPREALPLVREAVEQVDRLGSVNVGEAFVRLVLVEALLAVDETRDAHIALFATRDWLLARAEKILDATLRDSFLRRVPENARVLALAAEAQADS